MVDRWFVIACVILLMSAGCPGVHAAVLDHADPNSPDLYLRLGVTPDASPEELKSQYKKFALRYHPDRGGNATLFRSVDDAYQILKDPEKRHDFDEHRKNPALLWQYKASETRSARWEPRFRQQMSASKSENRADSPKPGPGEDPFDFNAPTAKERAYFKEMDIPVTAAHLRIYRVMSMSGFGEQRASAEQWARFQKIRSKSQLEAIVQILKTFPIGNPLLSPRTLDRIIGMTDEKKLDVVNGIARRVQFQERRSGKFLPFSPHTVEELASIGPEKAELLDLLRNSNLPFCPDAIQVLAELHTQDQERAFRAVITPGSVNGPLEASEADAVLLHRILDVTPGQAQLLEELRNDGFSPLSALTDGNLEIFKSISNRIQAKALALLTRDKFGGPMEKNHTFSWKGMEPALSFSDSSQLQILWAIEKKNGDPNAFLRPPYLEEIIRAKDPRTASLIYERITHGPDGITPETLFPDIQLTQSLHNLQDSSRALLSCILSRMSGKR